ncbi:MAG TPA: N-acetylmuramoyl-L-alanine amidase [Kiritimatiellia bacterium]|nr:N-acetylmuramoyl-L-alanine amidase [Kiritimatiellia bacterium]HRU70569.1 N-acetylmuramoyl-L-alanine amidase [Kiritimatiellia bacterium]
MTTGSSPRVTGLLLLFVLASSAVRGDAPGGAITWRSLQHVQRTLGVTRHLWDGETICFSNSQNVIRFYPGRRKADVNGTVVWLNAPVEGSSTNSSWRWAAVDLDLLQLAVLQKPSRDKPKPLRVLLDPGHGGVDEGARCPDPLVKEKDLTLALAKRIGAQLKEAGLHVDYTRTRDVTLTLGARTRLARSKKADLFISIHANHASNPEACGVETYVLPPCGYPGTADGSRVCGWQIGNRNDFHNTLLGFSIHRHLASIPETFDRGLKRQSFFVLRETSCPAVLLEFGFLSNTNETRRMLRDAWQSQSCAAVVDGVLAYARNVKTLDRTVAEKRTRDAENNERWRKHLAAQAARAAAEAEAQTNRQRAVVAPSAVSLPAATRTALTNAVASASPTLQPQGTNTAPIQIDALLEFYTPDKVQ